MSIASAARFLVVDEKSPCEEQMQSLFLVAQTARPACQLAISFMVLFRASSSMPFNQIRLPVV